MTGSDPGRWGIDARRLRARREALGLSQQDLAARVRKTVGLVSGLERGVRGCTAATLRALAIGLACSADHLLRLPRRS